LDTIQFIVEKTSAIELDASSLDITWFPLSATSSNALKKTLLGDNPMFYF
jgi:hypothetical protein